MTKLRPQLFTTNSLGTDKQNVSDSHVGCRSRARVAEGSCLIFEKETKTQWKDKGTNRAGEK